MKRLFILLLLCTFSTTLSQPIEKKFNFLEPSDTLIQNRKVSLLILHSVLLTSNVLVLDHHYHKGNSKTELHFKKDINGAGMIDKYAHGFFSYQFTRLSNESLIWSGTNKNTSLIISNVFGISMLTVKEILDGVSENSGWSWYDFSSNFIGAGLYTGQQLLWKKQRIQPKFSYNDSRLDNYLTQNNTDLSERLLKNYEAHTYWISINLNSFLQTEFIPNWLNFSVGYSVNGYLKSKDATSINEKYRSYFLSLDIDLTEIKTNSHFLKTLFSILNTIKIPAPTLQFSSNKNTRAHLFYF